MEEVNSNATIIYIENNNENNNNENNNNENNNNENNNNDNNKNYDNDKNYDSNQNENTNNSNNANKCLKCKMQISEGIGWIGSVIVLIPYVVTFDKTTDFVLNTLGASGLFIVCVTSKQYQSVVINAAWIVGGIYKYFYS